MPNKPSGKQSVQHSIQIKRPWSLKVIFSIFTLWTVLGWLRMIHTLSDWELLSGFLPKELVVYLAAVGLFWGLISLPAMYAIIRRSTWAPIAIRAAALATPAAYWVERLFLWRDPFAQRNWPFMLLLTIIWVVWVGITLQSRSVKGYFNHLDVEG